MGYPLKKILTSLPPGPRPPHFIGVAEPLVLDPPELNSSALLSGLLPRGVLPDLLFRATLVRSFPRSQSSAGSATGSARTSWCEPACAPHVDPAQGFSVSRGWTGRAVIPGEHSTLSPITVMKTMLRSLTILIQRFVGMVRLPMLTARSQSESTRSSSPPSSHVMRPRVPSM